MNGGKICHRYAALVFVVQYGLPYFRRHAAIKW